jgi:hypothetical protein
MPTGSDGSADYILDFMAPLLGHQSYQSLGFTTLQQQNVDDSSDETHEYCYIGAYGNGAEVLWDDPACAAYNNSNGDCIPSYFTLSTQ